MTQESLLTVRPVATGERPASTNNAVADQPAAQSVTATPVPKVQKPETGEGVRDQQSRTASGQDAPLDEVREAVQRLQSKLAELRQNGLLRRTRLEFELDEEYADKILVKIIDTETDEVVREVPPRELVEFAKRLSEAMGVILDTFA